MILTVSKPTFSSREIATATWAAIGFILILFVPKVRPNLVRLLRSALKWKLLAPIAIMAAYVAAVVALLARVGFWTSELRKETAFWFLFAGIAVLFSGIDRAAEERGFWRRLLRDQVKVTLIFEWLMNEYTFALWAELLIVPAILLLVMMDAVAGTKDEFKQVRRLTSWVLAGFGFFVLGYAARQALGHLNAEELSSAARTILIGPILSVAIIPLAYAFALLSAYEMLVLRLRYAVADRHDRDLIGYIARRIFWRCKLRPRKIWQFWRAYLRNLHGVRSRAEVDAIISLSKVGRRGVGPDGEIVGAAPTAD